MNSKVTTSKIQWGWVNFIAISITLLAFVMSYTSTNQLNDTSNESKIVTKPEVIKTLQNIIMHQGYSCASVDGARQLLLESGFKVDCNDYRYIYHVIDKGGNWIVEVK